MLKNRFYTIIFLLFIVSSFTNTVKAQSPTPDSLLTKALATDELLPVLIDSAVKYSPEVNRIDHTLEYTKDEQKINKNSIYNFLSFLSSYNYGTNFSAISKQSGFIGNNFTKSETGYYNVGVGLQLPLAYLLNRKNISHADESLVKANQSEKEKAALFVKQEVIRLYQAFKLAHMLTIISSKNKQAAQINYDLAEKNFVQGQTELSEITRIQDILNKAAIEFETNVNNFQTNFLQLEAYCGINLSLLIKKVK